MKFPLRAKDGNVFDADGCVVLMTDDDEYWKQYDNGREKFAHWAAESLNATRKLEQDMVP